MPKNKNPLNLEEKHIPERMEPDIETDSFSKDDQDAIVQMVMDDYETGLESMSDWLTQREMDLKHYYGKPPSKIENLSKRKWQSDRNMGLCAATCDIYQATLFSTCWNPETIHFIATEKNDVDNKENLGRFAKWAVGRNEGNVSQEIDDFIHNRIVQGFSVLKIWWDVWYEWVDKRIPKKNGGYTIKTENRRFERAVIANIPDLEDILIPDYGKDMQDQTFIIHVIHKTGGELKDLGDRGVFNNITDDFVKKLKNPILEDERKKLSKEKAESLGVEDITDDEIRVYPIDLYEWYGMYTIKGKTERYRFVVEPQTETLLSGKPLRKITRSGKVPFVGGSFIRVPGRVRGHSLPKLIAPVINAFNNVYNQKSDVQTITNMPFGFFNPSEGYTQQAYELEPGIMYPHDGDLSKGILFPNLQRSMAWAENDIKILFEILEKLTGAASFFLTSERNTSGTATRDMIVSEKSETKFGLWVKRIQVDLCEALNMFIGLYQDWAPKNLGERVIGADGKELIHNLSIDSLRGDYDVLMTPDILTGSKVLERQTQMWLFTNLQQSPWMNPMINPRGNWNLVADTMKIMGRNDMERYLPPEPKAETGRLPEIEDEFSRFMQGDVFDPPEGKSAMAYQHFIGHQRQYVERYHKLDDEAGKPAFDAHLFKTAINLQMFMAEAEKEKMANQVASNIIQQPNQQPQLAQPMQPQNPMAINPSMGQPAQGNSGGPIV